eukprot:278892-Prorocentrum_minimum.AAC.1
MRGRATFGEGHVEEELAAVQHARHVCVRYVSQQLHPPLQLVGLHHVDQQRILGAVPADDEVHV